MLDILRGKNVKKLVLIAILVLILPAFVLWGTGNLGREKDKGPSYAGIINNKRISFAEFAGSLVAIRTQIILNYFNQPKVLDALLGSKAFLGKLAWDRLLMVKAAKKAGVKIADADIVKFIRNHPIFLRNDKFNEKLYLYVLRNSMRIEPRAFEEFVRENLAIQRLNDQVTKNVTATDTEVLEAYRIDNDKFKISYILFDLTNFLDKTAIPEEQIKNYYEDHKNEFVLPGKDGTDGNGAGAIASFDDAKENIRTFLAERSAREIAIKRAGEDYTKLMDMIDKDNISFETAAAKLGLHTKESAFFAQGEYLEGIGEANAIAVAAVKLAKGDIARPIDTRKGAVIFKVVDTEKPDPEKFKKEKDAYAKRALEMKKALYLENWLRGLEIASKINIDFKEYEKYYR